MPIWMGFDLASLSSDETFFRSALRESGWNLTSRHVSVSLVCPGDTAANKSSISNQIFHQRSGLYTVPGGSLERGECFCMVISSLPLMFVAYLMFHGRLSVKLPSDYRRDETVLLTSMPLSGPFNVLKGREDPVCLSTASILYQKPTLSSPLCKKAGGCFRLTQITCTVPPCTRFLGCLPGSNSNVTVQFLPRGPTIVKTYNELVFEIPKHHWGALPPGVHASLLGEAKTRAEKQINDKQPSHATGHPRWWEGGGPQRGQGGRRIPALFDGFRVRDAALLMKPRGAGRVWRHCHCHCR